MIQQDSQDGYGSITTINKKDINRFKLSKASSNCQMQVFNSFIMNTYLQLIQGVS